MATTTTTTQRPHKKDSGRMWYLYIHYSYTYTYTGSRARVVRLYDASQDARTIMRSATSVGRRPACRPDERTNDRPADRPTDRPTDDAAAPCGVRAQPRRRSPELDSASALL